MTNSPQPHKAGFVNIIGKANAGKSTLLNALLGEALTVVNAKAQTTRHRILGVLNSDHYQIVFSDTPGLLQAKYKLQEQMMGAALSALEDADIIVLVVDSSQPEFEFENVTNQLKSSAVPVIVLLNKCDLVSTESLGVLAEEWAAKLPGCDVLPISAKRGDYVHFLLPRILKLLPEHPAFYPKDQLTDRSERFFVSEIIRGHILELYAKEIPYAVQVEIDFFKEEENRTYIRALLFVERPTQKAILIGHKGSKMKKLGIESRKSIEAFLQRPVFLELFVKVEENWRSNDLKLRRFGYLNS